MIASPDFHYTRDHFLDLRTIFFKYASRTLKKAWEERYVRAPNPSEVFSHRQSENARGRQYRLFHTRCAVTCTIPILNRHTEFLDMLTAEGMSSDDDDLESTEGRRYIIARKQWRSAALTQFLRILDQLAVKLRLEKRGQPPRVRVEVEDRWSTSGPIHSLPKNAYLDSWLDGMIRWRREQLDAKDELYDFTFPEWIHEQLASVDGYSAAMDTGEI